MNAEFTPKTLPKDPEEELEPVDEEDRATTPTIMLEEDPFSATYGEED